MAEAKETQRGVSTTQLTVQFFLICMVFGIWSTPLIHPIKIMVVLFHELSHGLMALATGGTILSIEITQQEGGLCETEGGHAALIVSAGYLGSMFFGGLLLYLSKFREYVGVVYTMLTILLAAAIFSVLKDPYTRDFATGLAGAFVVLGLLAPSMVGAFFLQLLGTVSCLYSLFDIYGDVLARSGASSTLQNDATVFSELTGVSTSLIGFLWLAVSFVYFVVVLRFRVRATSAEVEAE